eukprot:6209393-Pleurochrysis_carterae.AAC.1
MPYFGNRAERSASGQYVICHLKRAVQITIVPPVATARSDTRSYRLRSSIGRKVVIVTKYDGDSPGSKRGHGG